MNQRSLLYLIVLIAAFSACKKEESREAPLSGNTCDYAPYTTGSQFEYQQTGINPVDTFNYVMRVKGDTVVDGSTYRLLRDEETGDFSMFQCRSTVYTQLMSPGSLPDAPAEAVRTNYLYTNIALGGGWSEQMVVTIPGLGDLLMTINYTIVKKGTSKTVLGKEYNNVIGVRMDISVPPIINSEELSTTYYAKGLGLIEMDMEEDTTRLKTYTIR